MPGNRLLTLCQAFSGGAGSVQSEVEGALGAVAAGVTCAPRTSDSLVVGCCDCAFWGVLSVLSHQVVSDSLRPLELQHASLPVPHYLPEFAPTHVH